LKKKVPSIDESMFSAGKCFVPLLFSTAFQEIYNFILFYFDERDLPTHPLTYFMFDFKI
jgi:hypothetical protein